LGTVKNRLFVGVNMMRQQFLTEDYGNLVATIRVINNPICETEKIAAFIDGELETLRTRRSRRTYQSL